jgi:hypothetical protein
MTRLKKWLAAAAAVLYAGVALVLVLSWPVSERATVFCPRCGETGVRTRFLWRQSAVKPDGNPYATMRARYGAAGCGHEWTRSGCTRSNVLGQVVVIRSSTRGALWNTFREGRAPELLQAAGRTEDLRLLLAVTARLGAPEYDPAHKDLGIFLGELCHEHYADSPQPEIERLAQVVRRWAQRLGAGVA